HTCIKMSHKYNFCFYISSSFICLPSRGEEIENKDVIIQELEVRKEADNFWESYSFLQGYIHIQTSNYFLQTESQTPLDNLASPPTFPLQRDFTVFLGKFKAHILSQF
uniref:Uncharacterized protein n=1 Tax=Spermophilus dauricus TaxID=99837 RepID=A0A8C9UMY9_SPEDA